MSAWLAFAAVALGVAALSEIARDGRARTKLQVLTTAVASALDAVLRLGREGREPGALERRRLLAAGAALALFGGWLAGSPFVGAALAMAAPAGVGRLLRARRQAYRGAVERDASAIATGLADALSGGHSLRGAVAQAAASVPAAGGAELRRTAGELAAGMDTERALNGLRRRSGAPSLDAVVAAALVHRRAGGDLAGLLRELAHGFEDGRRLEDEVRAATAQARFTGLIVVALPLGGGLLAELASPGFALGLMSSLLTAWLVGIAVVLQVAAALLIRRLGRVRA